MSSQMRGMPHHDGGFRVHNFPSAKVSSRSFARYRYDSRQPAFLGHWLLTCAHAVPGIWLQVKSGGCGSSFVAGLSFVIIHVCCALMLFEYS